jgi:hypothetical protein
MPTGGGEIIRLLLHITSGFQLTIHAVQRLPRVKVSLRRIFVARSVADIVKWICATLLTRKPDRPDVKAKGDLVRHWWTNERAG